MYCQATRPEREPRVMEYSIEQERFVRVAGRWL